jgi:hypothetical protein
VTTADERAAWRERLRLAASHRNAAIGAAGAIEELNLPPTEFIPLAYLLDLGGFPPLLDDPTPEDVRTYDGRLTGFIDDTAKELLKRTGRWLRPEKLMTPGKEPERGYILAAKGRETDELLRERARRRKIQTQQREIQLRTVALTHETDPAQIREVRDDLSRQRVMLAFTRKPDRALPKGMPEEAAFLFRKTN